MKKLALFAVAATFAVLTSNLNAQTLHSPRGLANEIRSAAGTTGDSLDRAHLFAHRGDYVGHPTAPGVTADALNRNLGAISPRVLATFPELAAPAKGDAMAACKTMKKGECSLPCCHTTGACAMPCCKS